MERADQPPGQYRGDGTTDTSPQVTLAATLPPGGETTLYRIEGSELVILVFTCHGIDVNFFTQRSDALDQADAPAAKPTPALRLSYDQLACITTASELYQRLRHIIAGDAGGFSTQRVRQLECFQHAFASCQRHARPGRCINVDGQPVGLQFGCQTRCGTHQLIFVSTGANGDHDTLLGLPQLSDGAIGAVSAHVSINPVGGATQSDFA